MARQLYLNNNGDRWTYREKEPRTFMLVGQDGQARRRHATHFSQLGNFAVYHFTIGRERRRAFAEDCETINGLPVVRKHHRDDRRNKES